MGQPTPRTRDSNRRWVAFALLGLACGRTSRNPQEPFAPSAAGETGVTAPAPGSGGTSQPPDTSSAGEPTLVGIGGAGGEATDVVACGDGSVQPSEECDDGNLLDGDGCDADCTRSRVVELAAGDGFTCARLDTGLVKCWGVNLNGPTGAEWPDPVGDDPNEMGPHLPFVNLGTGARASTIAAGDFFTCAVLVSGKLECWGLNVGSALGAAYPAPVVGILPGQMGDALLPVDLGTRGTPKSIVAGGLHGCAMLSDESSKCWGANGVGQLGQGVSGDRGAIAEEMGDALPAINWGTGRSVRFIAAGTLHTCALLDDTSVKCVGYPDVIGSFSDTGDLMGDEPDETGEGIPTVRLGTARRARALAAGAAYTCAILDDGSVKCWGLNDTGQLGLEDNRQRSKASEDLGDNLPVVNLGTGRTALVIAAGYSHTCAILDDRTLKCWGRNANGCLGLGDTDDRGASPHTMGDALPVVDLGVGRHAVSLALGTDHTCVILDDDSVKCWGAVNPAALGYGDHVMRGGKPGQMGDALPTVALW